MLAGSAVVALAMSAADNVPLWMRDVALSPDGSTIAFTYKGDIYSVPFSGGMATRLTSSPAFDFAPVWGPDGKKIAFASDREGSDDIFIMEATGGTPVRLTSINNAAETPRAFLDDETILYSTSQMPGQQAAGGNFLDQMYTVKTTPGSRPTLYLSMPMTSVDVNKTGKLIYQNKKGYEDVLRKHERSSGTPDVWTYDPVSKKFTQLTDFNGANTNPVWGGEEFFFYLNDSNGTNNVYVRNLAGSERRLTDFEKHPVRNLSANDTGNRLAFSQDGNIYTMQVDGSGNVTVPPSRLNISIVADNYDSDLVKDVRTSGASTMAVAPDGSEIAFIIRGDVYVTDAKYKTTKRITNTAGQERVVDFAPDGKSLVYDSERDGLWRIYTATIAPADTIHGFAYAPMVTEKLVYESKEGKPAQQPAFSPDGKKVAFLEDRTGIKVLDLASGKAVTVLDPKYNYSYSDGDTPFQWSPDSKWLLAGFTGEGRWNNSDILLVSADGKGEPIDLTLSGYSDSNPQWTADGGGITYLTGKYGYRSHGSWGNQDDVVLMMLNPEKWDEFKMTEEEVALADDETKKTEEKKAADDKKGKKGKKEEAAKKPEMTFDLDNRLYRQQRLTPVSGFIGDYKLSPKNDRIYYSVQGADGKTDLMMTDLKKQSTTRLLSDVSGGFVLDKKGEKLYVISSKGLKVISLPKGESTTADIKSIEFEAEYSRVPSAEREYMYNHVLSQVRDKFYDKNLHGVDWEMYGEEYRKFLPHINNNRDFATLLSELLGELNASHTGGRAYGNGAPAAVNNAVLGAFFDADYSGDGLKVTEVLPRGPLATNAANIKPGDVINSIDGITIEAGKDYSPMLEGKAGKKVILGVRRADGKSESVTVKPITPGRQNEMLYERFVERNRAIVDSISGGKVGYVHVRGMDSPSFRTVFDDILGRHLNCDAIIVDTRYNGGGWLHDDIARLLSGKEYVRFAPQGRFIGHEPFAQWTKPSVMLINESNYSDAHGTPYVYKTLGIGKLVGAPIPGTMTAVWWETLIDPSIVFGIPQVTSLDVNGNVLENQQLDPDILIYNQPEDVLRGVDAQLEGAVRELLRQIQSAK